MVNEMSLRLEKLVEDVKQETILWPIEDTKNSPNEDAAWARIGARHKMTGANVKSIFKVLSKKYEVEKANPNSEWKLFNYMSFLDQKKEEAEENDEDYDADDGEEFVELLEVNDEYCSDDDEPNTSGGSNSEHSSKNASSEPQQLPHTSQIPPQIQIRKIKNDKNVGNKEKNEAKNGAIKKVRQSLSSIASENGVKTNSSSIIVSQVKSNERSSASPVPRRVVRIPMSLSKNNNVSVQEKKAQSTLTSGLKLAFKKDEKQRQTVATSSLKEVKLKRRMENSKITDKEDKDLSSPPIKRQIVLPKGIKVITTTSKSSANLSKISTAAAATTTTTTATTTTSTSIDQQQENSNENRNSNFMPISPTDKLPPFSSLLKKSPTSLLKDQENKISQHKHQEQQQPNHEQDKNNKNNDIPLQLLHTIKTEIPSPSHQSTNLTSNVSHNNNINGIDTIRKDFNDNAKLEIEQISKDADENTEIKVKVLTEQAEKILPTFFRDLYNSKKYDSFGMYVSSTMNRLPSFLASKLEAKILQSIIEINAMVDERMEEI